MNKDFESDYQQKRGDSTSFFVACRFVLNANRDRFAKMSAEIPFPWEIDPQTGEWFSEEQNDA